MVQRLHPKRRLRSNSEAVAHTQKGFNLIEAAIVLGVVGLVIGGIWVAAAAVSENHKIKQATSGVLSIVENIRRLFHGNWPDVQTQLASDSPIGHTMGIFDGADGFYYNDDDGKMHDPWGTGNFYIELNFTYSGTFVPIGIWFHTVSVAQCIKIVSAITSRFHDNDNLIAVALPVDYHTFITTIPLVPTKAQCTGTNYIGFAFSH